MLTVIKPGMQMSVQDAGRVGFRHLGVAKSGVLDQYAQTIANRLVGNEDNAPVIEITLGLAELKFECETIIALQGADLKAKLDNQPIYPGWRYTVKKGQSLMFASARNGFRSYLAIKGGIDVENIMDSSSTDLGSGFGGFNSRALKSGDQLSFGQFDTKPNPQPSKGAIAPAKRRIIRLHPSPHNDLIGEEQLIEFVSKKWQITPQSNRMGLRLSATGISLKHNHSLPSLGVEPGSIQLPPNGEPIILLNDCQTTGGYPLLGTVISADLHQFAQFKAGDDVQFEFVDLATAKKAQQKLDSHLNQWALALHN